MALSGQHQISQLTGHLLQDIDEAIHRLPQDVVDARMQRLKRAVDCSLKKSYLSKEIQDMQTPYSWYLKVMQTPSQSVFIDQNQMSASPAQAYQKHRQRAMVTLRET